MTTPHLTADQYFDLPEQTHTELINGEMVVNRPSLRHQRIVGWIHHQMMRHLDSHPGSGEPGIEIDIPIDEANVFAPDVWWTTPEHILPRDALRAAGPPDLAVEIRSPSTWRYDLGLKRALWEAAGLPELWLVDTEADTVIVLRRSTPDAGFDVALEVGRDDVLSTPLIPGFSLDVGVLFDR